MHNTVHFILQGKGGIGKTLVSTILAQWVAGKDELPLRCYDTDQENATFSRYKAMNVKHVPVMTDTRMIDPKRFDALLLVPLGQGPAPLPPTIVQAKELTPEQIKALADGAKLAKAVEKLDQKSRKLIQAEMRKP